MRWAGIIGLAAVVGLMAGAGFAHVSEQAFVLLLPTDIYIAAGVAAVALTVLILMLAPPQEVLRVFATLRLPRIRTHRLARVTRGLSAVVLLALLWLGAFGPTDPTKNLLPLSLWTFWWIGLVTLQGLFGDLWRWINPLRAGLGIMPKAGLRLPRRLGSWPGLALFLAFMGFLLADTTPADPRRLAWIVGGYWAVTLVGAQLFGPRWFLQVEFVTVLMRTYARLGLWARGQLGLWGARVLRGPMVPLSGAIFVLCLLGSGSLDGLNETFWWLDLIGVNPLAFPGRSAVRDETLLGLLGFNLGLVLVFVMAVWAGRRLAQGTAPLGAEVRRFAPAVLPIALGYHLGHYLPTFLVDIQYLVLALSDPMGRGDDLLGLGEVYVSTGFFNTQSTVRAIWLAQASAVVLGHVVAVLLAHGLAIRHYGDARRAALSQVPIAGIMVLYTFFGLWLLASPRGA